MRRAATLLALLAAAGCGELTGVRVVDFAADQGRFVLVDVALAPSIDLEALRGETVVLHGGARLDLDRIDEAEDRGANRAALVRGAQPVRAAYRRDGAVAVPADFDSLVMASAFVHLEQAAAFFAEHGAPVPPAPCLVAPQLTGTWSLPDADALAYVPGLDLFLLLPPGRDADPPLAVHRATLTHETSHRVWYYELWGGSLMSVRDALDTDPSARAGLNLLRAANEGVADYFAAADSGDPRFVAHASGASPPTWRDLDRNPVLDPAWCDGTAPLGPGGYDPYRVGSVLAASLWRIGDRIGNAALTAALLGAMRRLGAELRTSFSYTLGDLERHLLAELPDDARAIACAELAPAYAPIWPRLAEACR